MRLTEEALLFVVFVLGLMVLYGTVKKSAGLTLFAGAAVVALPVLIRTGNIVLGG